MSGWWTKALKSLVSADERDRLDLFRMFPGTRRFLAARHNYAYMRIASDLLFIFILLLGIFGPRDPENNIAVFLSWGVIWPLIVLSWFFVGRMWCGVCPFPGLGVFLQNKGWSLNLPVPRFLKKYGVYMSVFLLALIIWTEVVGGLDRSPLGTAFFLLAIVFGASLFSALFPGQAWCRHLCPLGRISGAAATLAITEFRPDHDKCRGCTSFACKKGVDGKRGCPVYLGAFNVQNNLHCLVCGHCLPACDRDSPQLLLRNPYSELIRNKGRYITCTYIVPFLIGSQLARFFRETPNYAQLQAAFGLSDAVLFSILLVLGFAAVLVLINFGSRLFGVTEDPMFGKFAPMVPILIPISFTGELVYRMYYFTAGLGDFLPTAGRQFGLALLEKLQFTVPDFPVQMLAAVFMLNGTIAGCYILWQFCLRDFDGMVAFRNFVGINLLIIALLSAYLVVIF